ncbi:Os04g0371700 [Oryza sativa Japonica Group]|uniref:OSJNBb0076A22.13 protein n=1 Tax=Oryza sativa subsp. japonica TaxID=39947 RepID=Q7XV72_ORYSJ|nr:Os04g0371700 [Oryza sativa Japonica Group]CAD40802.3 OSJNBb0076A22.13 [Oryza sativa Japonica Group]|eukprot:NP_001052567.1 Os04g0371700 [Oryza sativa Japonica Group]
MKKAYLDNCMTYAKMRVTWRCSKKLVKRSLESGRLKIRLERNNTFSKESCRYCIINHPSLHVKELASKSFQKPAQSDHQKIKDYLKWYLCSTNANVDLIQSHEINVLMTTMKGIGGFWLCYGFGEGVGEAKGDEPSRGEVGQGRRHWAIVTVAVLLAGVKHQRGSTTGICATLLVALTSLLGIEWIKYKQRIKRHDLMRKRGEYFNLHGGQLLTDMMNIENNISFKLYDRDEIELATKGFDKMSIIGEGGQGTVFKGYNLDQVNNPVAIKMCKGFDENSRTEFTQELLILSRVNHENIVKLIGCCLQFEVPVLVYEFVPNKTLHYLIHSQNDPSIRTLEIRLKVAAESAEAFSYLHSLDHPILHGDISDFGCSKIRAADGHDDVVKGTIGYLDPEYLLKFELTDKSDVYSFGVILLELLTRRTPLSKQKVSLASVFQEAMKEGLFLELIDTEILHEDNMGLIGDLARLACQCLAMTSESRPTMSRIAEELRRIEKQVRQHRGVLTSISSLSLSASSSADTSEHFTGETNGYDSLRRVAAMSIEFAR